MSNMHNPAHPGEVLREYLPQGVSIGEVAKHLGVTRQALSALLNGRAGVSASMALRLEGSLGTSAEMWLNMQTSHDLWLARKRPPRVSQTSRLSFRSSALMSQMHTPPHPLLTTLPAFEQGPWPRSSADRHVMTHWVGQMHNSPQLLAPVRTRLTLRP
jgi:antitoxin HigA-1